VPGFRSPGPGPDIVTRLRAAGCVFAEDEAQLLADAARTPAELDVMVARRAAGLPLEHVVGWAEFCGLRIAVDPRVFVPRRRTEFLVGHAIALARGASAARAEASAPRAEASAVGDETAGAEAAGAAGLAADAGGALARHRAVVVDLCCGSGAAGAAVAAALGGRIELHAADIDPAAVRCARRNLAAGVQVHEGDLYDALPAALRDRIDVLIANVPYVPTAEVGLLPPEARIYEERVALDGGADGLDVLRRVTAAAPLWLAPGGHLLVETSEQQAPRATGILARAGLVPRVASSSEMNATVVIGTRPARRSGPGNQSGPASQSEPGG
jgi:release factor glutamine methyltransferase